MPLFVELEAGVSEQHADAAVRTAIRTALSPRYVPDEVVVLSSIPHTRTG
jgi:acetoacetyl-CoA synthetase